MYSILAVIMCTAQIEEVILTRQNHLILNTIKRKIVFKKMYNVGGILTFQYDILVNENIIKKSWQSIFFSYILKKLIKCCDFPIIIYH